MCGHVVRSYGVAKRALVSDRRQGRISAWLKSCSWSAHELVSNDFSWPAPDEKLYSMMSTYFPLLYFCIPGTVVSFAHPLQQLMHMLQRRRRDLVCQFRPNGAALIRWGERPCEEAGFRGARAR